MGVEHRPEYQIQPEPPSDWQAPLATAVNTLVETLFLSDAITERLRGYEGDRVLQRLLTFHKQALTEQLVEETEAASEIFLTLIDGLQSRPGVPLYPPLAPQSEPESFVNRVKQNKPFTVASICREDLRDILTAEEIARLSDGEMESIADRMSDAYRDSGGYWESLEIMARFVLDKTSEEKN